MQELTELNEGDELHITIEGGKKVPLTVGNVNKWDVLLQYDGKAYAELSESGVTNDDYDWTLITLRGEKDEVVGVEKIEVV